MKSKRWFVILGLLVIFGLQNIGCDRMPSPTSPSDSSLQTNENAVMPNSVSPSGIEQLQGYTIVKSWEEEKLISYEKGGWVGDRNVAFLTVAPESMIPAEDTKISLQVFLTSDNELVINFQPEMQFSKSAILVLNYKLLVDKFNGSDSDILTLSLLTSDGKEELSTSNTNDKNFKWDNSKKKVSFQIDHFSIYLISKD